MKIRITSICMELHKAGVRVGDEYPAVKMGGSYFFDSPSHTQCVAYSSNCEEVKS